MRIRTPADLGAFIRERRTKLGMDQIALTKKAGTSRKCLWLCPSQTELSRVLSTTPLRMVRT